MNGPRRTANRAAFAGCRATEWRTVVSSWPGTATVLSRAMRSALDRVTPCAERAGGSGQLVEAFQEEKLPMDLRVSTPPMTTTDNTATMRLIALALALTLAPPAAAQVAVGKQIDIHGVTHEIVSFDFVSFEGTVHEILLPAPIQQVEGIDQLLSHVSVRYRPSAGCGQADDPPHEVAGLPATVTGVYAFYDMIHSQSTTSGPVQVSVGQNLLWYATNVNVCLHVTDTTDLLLLLNVNWGRYIVQNPARGQHRLALEHAPSLAEIEQLDDALWELLSYVVVR